MLSRLRLRASSFFSSIVTVLRLRPAYYTVMGLIFSFLYLAMMYQGNIFLALLFILLSGFMDVLDGLAARLVYSPSRFGAFIDSIFDRIEDGIYIMGLVFVETNILNILLVIVALMLTLLISYISAQARTLKLSTNNETTVMERSDRIILLSIILFTYAMWGVHVYTYLLIVYIALALYNITHNTILYKNNYINVTLEINNNNEKCT